MKISLMLLGAVMTAAVISSVSAEELKSGPQAGESVGAFYVQKAAGNESDGVPEGEKLCYRCKLGNQPVVTIFAHEPNKELAALLKEIDSVVAKNQEKKMASFVNLLGDDPDDLKSAAESLVKETKVEHIAVVVPEEHEQGPKGYKLNPKADVTVLVYAEGKVKANFAFAKENLNEKAIKEITEATAKMLKSAG